MKGVAQKFRVSREQGAPRAFYFRQRSMLDSHSYCGILLHINDFKILKTHSSIDQLLKCAIIFSLILYRLRHKVSDLQKCSELTGQPKIKSWLTDTE